jgi:hypothetical protein
MTNTTTTDEREISLFDEECPDRCGGTVGDCYSEDCGCADCENERALDDDYDA